MRALLFTLKRQLLSTYKILAGVKQSYMLLALLLLIIVTIATAKNRRTSNCEEKELNFVKAEFKIPNIVHFERRGQDALNISVSDAACIRAALRHQGPVWIHTENPIRTKEALADHGVSGVVLMDIPITQEPGPALLRNYGGILLKNDIYLLRNLNSMRTEECSATPGNDIVVCSKGVHPGSPRRLSAGEILLDKDWGALYILDMLKICSIKAVRLGTR